MVKSDKLTNWLFIMHMPYVRTSTTNTSLASLERFSRRENAFHCRAVSSRHPGDCCAAQVNRLRPLRLHSDLSSRDVLLLLSTGEQTSTLICTVALYISVGERL